MIESAATAVSDAARRAEMIYAQARSEIDVRLWRAALGSDAAVAASDPKTPTPALSIATLLELVTSDRTPRALPRATAAVTVAVPAASAGPAQLSGLGANALYSATIASAAQRAGIPAAALATIIDAEAAKGRDGSWQTGSRNTRSTATGLGQFLVGTWKSEAERAGTWLNQTARQNGWLGADGRVLPEARTALSALRNDADAAINATADYARQSLKSIAAAGVSIGTSVDQIAKIAYLGHNLGVGDAIRFLRGGLGDSHAQRLLNAQVGSNGAARRVADAGSAAAAHHGWLTEFMDRHIDTSRFSL
jgi:hypothetical protein